MYCSSCGASVEQGLIYCKRCGAKLGGTKGDSASNPDSLVWAMVSVFIAGLGVIIGLMSVMKKEMYFNDGVIILFTLISFLMMFTIEGVLISQLLRRNSRVKEVRDTSPMKGEAGATQARALAEPAASVTEHTTRTFEPIYSERKAE
jgi:uncharacterized protein (DUF983 family)